MKPVALVSALALLFALLLPVFWAPHAPETQTPDIRSDDRVTLTVRQGDGRAVTTLADYLPGVLAGEMPALFEPEALKAQAVAARTFILYRMTHHSDNHPGEDICDDPNCCKAFLSADTMRENWGANYETYYAKMQTAVRETDGQYLRYEGAPIQAVFHSSSAGQTQASGEIWNECPYLVSVPSPETAADVPDYVTEVVMSADAFREVCQSAYPDMVFPDDPARWLGGTAVNASGRAEHTTICGVDIPGTRIRAMFGLRSSAYTLDRTDAGAFQFTVTGYGHGVGMSQYGANVFAKSGVGYADILAHYYPGTELASG